MYMYAEKEAAADAHQVQNGSAERVYFCVGYNLTSERLTQYQPQQLAQRPNRIVIR